MAIRVQCKNPDCGKTFQVKDEHAGKSLKCPGCGCRLAVPPQTASAVGSDRPVRNPAPEARAAKFC